jgi:hypothetical protein
MSTSNDTLSAQTLKVSHAALSLNSTKRQEIGIHAIGGYTPISHVADRYGVSRKFVYQQKEKALAGIAQAFSKPASADSEKVLFYIPVTKQWLCQVVLALIFICRASYQGVIEFLRDIFDSSISKGTIHNIVHQHLEIAKKINQQQDLSNVHEGLHDEIYQAGDPVLVGCCARSTYCYLLSLVESCDTNSWGVHLLDLKEKQGLTPDLTVIDGGKSAHGDTFHALKPFLELVTYLENRAVDALKTVDDLNQKVNGRRGKWKDIDNRIPLYEKLLKAENAGETALTLANDIRILYRWLKNDILALVGPSYDIRLELLTFVIEELHARESLHHKITPIRTYLDNHKDNLLEFMHIMEARFYAIAQTSEVSLAYVLAVYELQGLPSSSQKRWQRQTELQRDLRAKFYLIESLVDVVLKNTRRANSLVENVNSRLRTYFTLRRELGNEYLHFLKFFLNHRRFMRSEREERVGKSPAELLTGMQHNHWLEILGFDLFKKAA